MIGDLRLLLKAFLICLFFLLKKAWFGSLHREEGMNTEGHAGKSGDESQNISVTNGYFKYAKK